MLDLLLRRAELGPDFRMVPVMGVTRDRIRRLLVVHRSGPRGRSCRAKEPASARYKYSPIEKWLRNFGRWDKWLVRLTAGTVVPANQEKHAQRPSRNHSPAFKAKVAIAAFEGDRTIAQLADNSASMSARSQGGRSSLKAAPQTCSLAAGMVGRARHRHETVARENRRANVGERFFRGRAHQSGIAERKTMIDRDHALSVAKQAELVGIARSTVYYLPRAVSARILPS